MPTLNIYPSSVAQNIGFSNSDNTLGWNGNAASFSGNLPMYTGVSMRLIFPIKDFVPVDSTISDIRLKVRASCASSNVTFYGGAIRAQDENTYVYAKNAAYSIVPTEQTFTLNFSSVETYIPSAQLLTGWDPGVEINFVNLNGYVITVNSLLFKMAWLEVDFTTNGETKVANIGTGTDWSSNPTWSDVQLGNMQDYAYTNRGPVSAVGGLYRYWFLNNASYDIPTNAVITGVLIDVFAYANTTSGGAQMWPKMWGLADGSVVAYLSTVPTLYRFGGKTNTLSRTRANLTGSMVEGEAAAGITFSLDSAVSTTFYLDHVAMSVYYTMPASGGNALLLSENF